MSQENCPKCAESLETKEHSPPFVFSRQKIFTRFCNSCAHIGLEVQGYLSTEDPDGWHGEINDSINETRLGELAECKCSNEHCETDPGYPPIFHSELTTKGIEIHSIRCSQPDCVGIIKHFQNTLIPFTSDKEKFNEVEPNKNPFKEQIEWEMKQKGNFADIMQRGAGLRSKSTDIPDDKHQREY